MPTTVLPSLRKTVTAEASGRMFVTTTRLTWSGISTLVPLSSTTVRAAAEVAARASAPQTRAHCFRLKVILQCPADCRRVRRTGRARDVHDPAPVHAARAGLVREGDGAPDAGLLGDDVEERVGGEHLRAAEHGAQEVLGKVRGENGRLDAEGRQGRERPAASGLLEVDGRGRAGGGKRLSEHGRAGAARIRAEEVGGGHAAAVLRGPFDGRVPAGSKSAHGQAADVGRAEAALEALRERKPGRAHDDVDARGRGVGEGFELVAHRPAGVDRVACACGGGPEGLEHGACREVERRRAQKVDAEGPRAGAVGNDEAAREFDPGLCAGPRCRRAWSWSGRRRTECGCGFRRGGRSP